SSVLSPAEQAKRLGEAWEALPSKPQREVCFRVVEPDGETYDFYLGAHAPRLADEDIDIIHKLWLEVTREKTAADAHHKEIVTVALERLEQDLKGTERHRVLEQIGGLMRGRGRAERAHDEERNGKPDHAGA